MNVLIIGFGSIAQKHANALRTLSLNTSIYALRSGKGEYKDPSVISIVSLKDLTIKLDFIIISNPTHLHKQTIEDMIELEVPLFIEKPSLNDLEGADYLVNIIHEKKIKTYVGCNLRFLECFEFLKEHLSKQGDKIQEITAYCGSYLPNWRPMVDFKKTYSANKEMGGGVHLDLIHEMDYLYWLFGIPLEVQKILRNHSHLHISAVDYAHYVYTYPEFVATVTLNYFRRDSKRTLEIVFDTKTWLIDIPTNTITCNGEVIFQSPQKILDTYLEQMRYFINFAFSSEEKSTNTFEDSIHVLKMVI